MVRSIILAGLVLLTSTPGIARTEAITEPDCATGKQPWDRMFDSVPPIRVLNPKAALTGSMPASREPILEITLKDLGNYFG